MSVAEYVVTQIIEDDSSSSDDDQDGDFDFEESASTQEYSENKLDINSHNKYDDGEEDDEEEILETFGANPKKIILKRHQNTAGSHSNFSPEKERLQSHSQTKSEYSKSNNPKTASATSLIDAMARAVQFVEENPDAETFIHPQQPTVDASSVPPAVVNDAANGKMQSSFVVVDIVNKIYQTNSSCCIRCLRNSI